jgi:hypothetical protein
MIMSTAAQSWGERSGKRQEQEKCARNRTGPNFQTEH